MSVYNHDGFNQGRRVWVYIIKTGLIRAGVCESVYNHDGFNALTETEKEKWFVFILRSTGAAVTWARSLRRAPNTLSALANKAFKVIVSCLTVWWIAQASTGIIYLKTGSAVMKLPGVMTPLLIRSLSCPECGCDFSSSFIYRYVFKQMFQSAE